MESWVCAVRTRARDFSLSFARYLLGSKCSQNFRVQIAMDENCRVFAVSPESN